MAKTRKRGKIKRRRKGKINLYQHKVTLTNLSIRNAEPESFRKILEDIPYLGYKVEDISDGRQIIITKPGGKLNYGTLRREDIMVWIFNPSSKTLWLISHKNIFEELEAKAKVDPQATISVIDAFEKVYGGGEPDDVIRELNIVNPSGESPEVLLKAYKWIWGQEDCNYPPPRFKGRLMSMKAIRKLRKKLIAKVKRVR